MIRAIYRLLPTPVLRRICERMWTAPGFIQLHIAAPAEIELWVREAREARREERAAAGCK